MIACVVLAESTIIISILAKDTGLEDTNVAYPPRSVRVVHPIVTASTGREVMFDVRVIVFSVGSSLSDRSGAV